MTVEERLQQLQIDYQSAHDEARARVERERDILTAMLNGRGESTTVAAVTDLSVDYADIDLESLLGS